MWENVKLCSYLVCGENDACSKPKRKGKNCRLVFLCLVSMLIIGAIFSYNMQAEATDNTNQVELKCVVSGNEILLGNFSIREEWEDDELFLRGSVHWTEEYEELIEDAEITWYWQANVDESVTDTDDNEIKIIATEMNIPATTNGLYTAVLRFKCSNNWDEARISYIVDYLPFEVKLKEELTGEDYIFVFSSVNTLSVNQLPAKEGMIFKGYEQDNILLITENGEITEQFVVLWKSGQLKEVLTAKWEPKTYHVYYGKDEDKNGVPDLMMEVIYGESYQNVEPLPDRGLSVFRGFYLGKDQIIDRNGKTKGAWIWDGPEDIILKAKYYRPAGSDLISSEDDSSQENENRNNENKVHDTNNQGNTNNINAENQEFIVLTEDGSESAEEDAGLNSEKIIESTEDIAGGISEKLSGVAENDFGDEKANTQKMPQKYSENSRNVNGESVEIQEAFERNQNPIPIEALNMEISREGAVHIPSEGMQETKNDDSGNQIAQNDKTNMTEIEMLSEDGIGTDVSSVEEKYLREKQKNQETAKAVGKITALVLVSSLALAGFILSIYLLWNSAILYTLNESGKRVRIVYVLINQKNSGYNVRINQRQLEESHTGDYLLWIPRWFSTSHKNDNITIELPQRKWTTLVQNEISFVA